MKLISMTDFVLDCVNNAPIEEYHQVNETFVNKVVNYANLLKQPLKLEMFVPCDDKGNVLKHLPYFDYSRNKVTVSDRLKKFDEYQKAKEKVLFEGFEVKKSPYDATNTTEYIGWEPYNASIFLNLRGSGWEIMDEYLIIEDLVKSKIELTPTAIKQWSH